MSEPLLKINDQRPRGFRQQVLGCILIALGGIYFLLAYTVGFEPDPFYLAMAFAGAGLYLFGTVRKRVTKIDNSTPHPK